jgi:hypothetical protein
VFADAPAPPMWRPLSLPISAAAAVGKAGLRLAASVLIAKFVTWFAAQ